MGSRTPSDVLIAVCAAVVSTPGDVECFPVVPTPSCVVVAVSVFGMPVIAVNSLSSPVAVPVMVGSAALLDDCAAAVVDT